MHWSVSVPGLRWAEGQDFKLIGIIKTPQGFSSSLCATLLGPEHLLASLLLLAFLSALLLTGVNSEQAFPTKKGAVMPLKHLNKSNHQ